MGELADYLVQHDDNFRKARLPALYSDFRGQRTLNPDGYNANIAAWRGALTRLASDGQLALLGPDSSILVCKIDNTLLRALEHKSYGQPLALGTVINDAISRREFMPLNEYMKLPQSIYQTGWTSLPWSVVGWAFRQLGVNISSKSEDRLPNGQYAILHNVEAASNRLRSALADKTSKFDLVFTRAQFQQTFATELMEQQRLSDTDFDVLLKYLSRDKNLITYDGTTIKWKSTGDETPVSEEDSSIASIKELTANLKHQSTLLGSRIEELEQEAKTAVARKNRVSALAALKSKKIAEASLATRYATLSQLEEVAAKIQQAADNVQLIKVMQSSTGVLQKLNAEIGGTEKVEGVMDRLREQMTDADEVAAILAESTGAPIDEGEIDEELAAMEDQEKTKEEEAQKQKQAEERQRQEAREAAEAQKRLEELPSVPTETGPERDLTPATETRIQDLSMEEEPERHREKPLPAS
ncbi:hypothetical protein S40285_05015 [Stachybotrys chlorohalonatus IBT 40285]|uniref:SNF7 family protein n=1 Tax=Stachybotrys chlorohalonatus (strain IBT 40285) TaxID=1283841 RepID=A0A084QFK8_STAC4|nr:hypothetical protein S40285_05015 [Stachybotrys chlorohalonata IBT 40285]